ncbi:MAG: hypothetical protein JXO49_10115 [Deltaproteobacteria bacterium]|nr:hypothetical protein [Candidatus Anaeroferrophillus wilburensis]MBN2889687.1 hypothetical protein [Deltaproteobacteria bacterium]
MGTATVEITLSADVLPALFSGHNGWQLPSGCLALSTTTTVKPFLTANKVLHSRVWFLASSGEAVARVRSRTGTDSYQKFYWVTAEGVRRIRLQPAGPDEFGLPPEQWTDREESFYPRPPQLTSMVPVSEPSLLFFHLTAQPTDCRIGSTLTVFNKKQFLQVRLASLDADAAEIQLPGNNLLGKNQPSPVHGIRLVSRPLNEATEEREEFSFLGLKGEISMVVDDASGIPLHISGSLPTLGRIHFKLKEAITSVTAANPVNSGHTSSIRK